MTEEEAGDDDGGRVKATFVKETYTNSELHYYKLARPAWNWSTLHLFIRLLLAACVLAAATFLAFTLASEPPAVDSSLIGRFPKLQENFSGESNPSLPSGGHDPSLTAGEPNPSCIST